MVTLEQWASVCDERGCQMVVAVLVLLLSPPAVSEPACGAAGFCGAGCPWAERASRGNVVRGLQGLLRIPSAEQSTLQHPGVLGWARGC